MIAAVLLLAAQTSDQGCDLSDIHSARAVHETLSRRAVEVVTSALDTGSSSDVRLRQLLHPTASFSLGAGDVRAALGDRHCRRTIISGRYEPRPISVFWVEFHGRSGRWMRATCRYR